jgi:plasmid stabilization system protein ParE
VAKKFAVEISRAAARDIESIYAFIARDNPAAAEAWLDTFEAHVGSLERWPRRGAIIPESPELDVEYRHLSHAPYRTVFRIAGSKVLIVRVIHGAQLLDLRILEL